MENVHNRRDVLEPILAWLTEPSAEPATLLYGRPGCGKTTVLATLASALAGQPSLRLAYAALRDHSSKSPVAAASEPELVYSVARAAGQGMPQIFGDGPDTILIVNSQIRDVAGRADIASIGNLHISSAMSTVDWLATVLERRHEELAASGAAGPTLVILIDALDELGWADDYDGTRANPVYQMLARAGTLSRSRVRLVLTSQTVPQWFRGPRINVEVTAAPEIESYAKTRLSLLSGEGLEASEDWVNEVSSAIARRADGLFIVAAGYLTEIAGGQVPDDLWEQGSLPSATRYFQGALQRMRGRYPLPEDRPAILNSERLLAILAASPSSLTREQITRVWRTGDIPEGTARRWKDVSAGVLNGPVGNYLTVSGADDVESYALFHPTLREAVMLGGASYGTIRVSSERIRYLQALTPLFPTGLAWDRVANRSVVQDAPLVLADVLEEILADDPSDPDADEWLTQCATLIESWEWMECCLAWHDPSHVVPLGLPALLSGLGRLAELERVPGLWSSGQSTHLPLPLKWQAPSVSSAKVVTQVRGDAGQEKPIKSAGDANARHHLIRDLITGKQSFTTDDDVKEYFQKVRGNFLVSDKYTEDEIPGTMVLWVQGYDVTQSERDEGCTGNFVALIPRKRGSRVFVEVSKRPMPARLHPRRTTPKRSHPNWGIRVLRNAKGNPYGNKAHVYPTRTEAEADIDWLDEEYPSATSKRHGRLGVLIYDPKRSRGPRPTRQFVLYVEMVEGGYILVAESQEHGIPDVTADEGAS